MFGIVLNTVRVTFIYSLVACLYISRYQPFEFLATVLTIVLLFHTHLRSLTLSAGLFGLDNASYGKVDEEIVKTWWEAFVNHDPVRLKQEYPWELAWARYVTSLSCGIHVGRITCVLPLVPIQISKYQHTCSDFERRRYSSILFSFNINSRCVCLHNHYD